MNAFAMVAVLVLTVCWGGHGFANEPLKVNTSIKPPFSTREETGFFDLLMKELGQRMDFPFVLVRQPPERALHSVNEGLSDIELPRVAGLEKVYPNLVQVEEKIIDYSFVAFSRMAGEQMSWDRLAGKDVGYLLGWKIFENNVPAEADVTKLTKPGLLFDMLAAGRIDVALYERYAGWNSIRSNNYGSIKECGPPLAVKPMFIYLHKQHAHLGPAISRHLRSMKSDGTYERIMKQTLGNM